MSSILDALKPTPKPAKPEPLKAPAIATQLEEARAALATEQSRYDAVAFAAVEGNPQPLADLERALADHRKKVASLEAAHRGAIAFDREQDLLRKADRIADQFAGVKRRLNERLKAAGELTAALEATAKAYNTLVEKSDLARRAWPEEYKFPTGTLTEKDKLEDLLEAEMHRLSAVQGQSGPRGNRLPGANSHGLMWENNPMGMASISTHIASANDGLVAAIPAKPGAKA